MLCGMGLFDVFKRSAAIAASSSASPVRTDIVSPFSAGQLATIVWSDVFAGEPVMLTREEALALPGVFKARAVLIALLADKPLVAYDAAELELAELEGRDPVPLDPQPAWLRGGNAGVSPWHRMAVTLDDIMFYGWSLWVRDVEAGKIVRHERVPIGGWKFAEDGSGRVLVDRGGTFVPVDASEVTLIPGPSEGLLAYASRSLEGARSIEESWVERARNPIPMIDLHQTTESNLTPDEAKAYVEQWNEARRTNGGAAFTPYDIQANALGQLSPDLYVEGRNAARVDIANYFNLPVSLLDGSVSTASLTYSTQEGDANEVALYTLPYWRDPIVGRLSLDDVAGAGVVIRQNMGGLVRTEQSPIGDPGNE
jgi:hypothetical protein